MKHKNFNINTVGRDFVCGDLHGCFDLLMDAMQFLEFDINLDRMFSVGDLIDRGPNSPDCLHLINASWFHPVKANHEQLMEDWMTGGPTGSWWVGNGGNWFNNLDRAGQDDIVLLLDKVQTLPWAITVELPNNKRFHVIHAEIVGHRKEVITDSDLNNERKFLDIAGRAARDGHSLLWGRGIFGELYNLDITKHRGELLLSNLKHYGATDFFNSELSHIYSGHTPMRNPTTILGQTNIDTMAFGCSKFKWAGLTITEPLTNTFWKTNNEGTLKVSPLVL